jgi:hypothetical protein
MEKAFTLAIVSFFLFCNLPTEDANTNSNDLRFSKKTLKVYNNFADTLTDQITIKNGSDHLVTLDSVFILFEAFSIMPDITDTLKISEYTDVHWVEDLYGSFGWHLQKIEQNKYKLIKEFFSPNDTANPIRVNPNDSCVLLDFQIGYNLVSEHIPEYPKYMKGSLQLHFSNKQVVEIKLYSDDLRSK